MRDTAVIAFQQREVFERNVTRALVAGVGAGALTFFTQRFHLPVPLPFLALVGAVLASVRGERVDRIILTALALTLPAVPWLLGVSSAWTIGLAGVVAGALMVRARVAERGEEGNVAAARPGPVHAVLASVGTGALAVAGTEVARSIAVRLADVSTPTPLILATQGVIIALFASIGSIATHLALKSDPVETRLEELVRTLSGELSTQMSKALTLYRHAGEQLAALPRDAAREELARTLQKLTSDAAQLASEWSGVEAQVQDSATADLKREIDELKTSAKAARDAVAKAQLENAAASLGEELTRLDELKLKRERVVAKLKAQVALLERARVALIGMRSTHATVRAAEMAAVSRKLNALAQGQHDEARLGHEVATSVELTALEQTRSDEQLAKTLEPVAPISSDTSTEGAPALPAPQTERE